MSPEGKAFKYLAKQYMPLTSFSEGAKFSLQLFFHGDWLYKNGKNKRADIQNLIKILLDAIFEKLGVDDSYVYFVSAGKIQNSSETYTRVIIEELDV